MITDIRQIYIDFPENEACTFTAEYRKSGYQVIYADEEWFLTDLTAGQMQASIEPKNAAGKVIEEHDSREVIDRHDAAEEILRHDAGEEWRNWAVGVCIDQEHINRMKDRGIAVIGYERTDDDRLQCDYVVQDLAAIDEMFLEEVFCRFQKLPLTVLKTERTIIREFAMCDFDAMYHLYQEPHMTDFMDGLLSEEQERACQKAYIETGYRFYGYGMWVVIHRENNRLIGRAGVENTELCDPDEVELGYAISVSFQKAGYATEVCRAIAALCFDRFEMKHIIARVSPQNIPSVKVLQKLGFTKRITQGMTMDGKEDIYELKAEQFA